MWLKTFEGPRKGIMKDKTLKKVFEIDPGKDSQGCLFTAHNLVMSDP